jgi:hypothetical protein
LSDSAASKPREAVNARIDKRRSEQSAAGEREVAPSPDNAKAETPGLSPPESSAVDFCSLSGPEQGSSVVRYNRGDG